jgi:hypothetical protein
MVSIVEAGRDQVHDGDKLFIGGVRVLQVHLNCFRAATAGMRRAVAQQRILCGSYLRDPDRGYRGDADDR